MIPLCARCASASLGRVACGACRGGGVRGKTLGMRAADPTGLNLDVYDTRDGLWNPEHGALEMPEGWKHLPTGDAFVTRRVKAAGVFWLLWQPRGRNRPHRRSLGFSPATTISTAQRKPRRQRSDVPRRGSPVLVNASATRSATGRSSPPLCASGSTSRPSTSRWRRRSRSAPRSRPQWSAAAGWGARERCLWKSGRRSPPGRISVTATPTMSRNSSASMRLSSILTSSMISTTSSTSTTRRSNERPNATSMPSSTSIATGARSRITSAERTLFVSRGCGGELEPLLERSNVRR